MSGIPSGNLLGSHNSFIVSTCNVFGILGLDPILSVFSCFVTGPNRHDILLIYSFSQDLNICMHHNASFTLNVSLYLEIEACAFMSDVQSVAIQA